MTWKNESARHSLSSRGIKSKITIMPNGGLKPKHFKHAKIQFHRKTNADKIKHSLSGLSLHTVPPIIKVDKTEYHLITNTLKDFTSWTKKKIVPYYTKDYSWSEPQKRMGFIVTDGNRYMLIDTQGYSYPRYKGTIEIDNKILKYWK